MHSNSILTSNLLDIIFENRNKDYGAYVLRRDYNKRLAKSLMIALILAVTFMVWLMFAGKNTQASLITPLIPDNTTCNFKRIEKIIEPKKRNAARVKSVKTIDSKVLIVKDNLVENVPLIDAGAITLNKGEDLAPPFEGLNTDNTGSIQINKPVKETVQEINKSTVVVSPDVLPEFPGGIKELIKFLKRNLNTPQELQDGMQVAVTVKFVVSYNGDLMSFNVIETGGELFDSEVIRVLKKMPKWIPGKSSGENVSTNFIIPVKFRVSD